LAEDWPVDYRELEGYYGQAERALGVAGVADNPFDSYRTTDYPLPPFPYNYDDRFFQKACDKLGIIMHHVPWARNSVPYHGRPPCQAFSTCDTHRICPISAQYTSERHIRLAEATGRARTITNANVVRINARSRRVGSVTYATPDRRQHDQEARIFVLAAHAIESARLLLLSESSEFPQGLANTSGMVGRNFMEHPYLAVPAKLKERVYPYRIGFNTAGTHQFVPTRRRDEIGSIKMDFEVRGPAPQQIALRSGKWGPELADEIRQSFGRQIQIAFEIEQLPNHENSISLDPIVKDYFGNPAPRISFSLGDYEMATAKKGIELAETILSAVGGAEIARDRAESLKRIEFGAHHMGTCRMGSDPDTSVVNGDLRCHAVDNLFIVGSSVFVTGGAVQPSLTIAALAIRAAQHVRRHVGK
jgi:choline dehydrogenase-like flavoprotein